MQGLIVKWVTLVDGTHQAVARAHGDGLRSLTVALRCHLLDEGVR